MIGFDCGTYNLVCCKRAENGDFAVNREVNAFLEIKLENRFIFNMMKTTEVALLEYEDFAYILGEAAVNMAYTMSNLELRRPMKDGCVNPAEKDAFEIMNNMIHNLIENTKHDKELLYYSVPANAINEQTDADYHGKLLQNIFDAYESDDGFKIVANPINEGLALVYAELGDKAYTGCGISCGAGQINVCMAIYGVPVFQFSLVNSGDWIDKQAARATQESIAFINQEKTKIDLRKTPSSLVERAIQTQYRIMIEKTIAGIKKGIEEAGKKTRTDGVDIVIAGGTSMAAGFGELFKEVLLQAKLPLSMGNIIQPKDPLYSVARGCLIAAENAAK